MANGKNRQSEIFRFFLDTFWVVDTGGKFATGVTAPVEHLDLRISPRIFEKIETVLMEYSGAGGKLIHEKNTRSKKSRDTVSLRIEWSF